MAERGRFPVGKDGDASLARRPFARREVVQHLRQAMLLQPLAQVGLLEFIGKQVFHAAEAGSLDGGKAIDEGKLSEQHREVGGKFRHGPISLFELLPLRPAAVCPGPMHPR